MRPEYKYLLVLSICLTSREAFCERDKSPGILKRRYVHACPAGTERVGDKPPKSKIIFCKQILDSSARLEGPYTSFYETGNKKLEGEYASGKKNGTWINYHRNGALAEKREFIDGKLVEKTSYRSDGSKIEPAKNSKATHKGGGSEYDQFIQASKYNDKSYRRPTNADLGWNTTKTKKRRSFQ